MSSESILKDIIQFLKDNQSLLGKRLDTLPRNRCRIITDDICNKEYAEMCDINCIVSQTKDLGSISFNKDAYYGDVTGAIEYEYSADGHLCNVGNEIFNNMVVRAINTQEQEERKNIEVKKDNVEDSLNSTVEDTTLKDSSTPGE